MSQNPEKISRPARTTAYDIGGFFRVEHQTVPHKPLPYEFVKRIGAVTMLPIRFDHEGKAQALVIENTRYHYGTALGLPAGNMDGGIDLPESPKDTALRELQEETGYGYPEDAKPDIAMFRLRTVSNTIDYPRYFGIMRDVSYIGGEKLAEHEQIVRQPIPLEQYVDPLFTLERGETYPEINAAFAKAGMAVGREAVLHWLTTPKQPATLMAEHFSPWLLAE